MPLRATRLRNEHEGLQATFNDIRESLEISLAFDADVEAEAKSAVADAALPELDATDVEFVTIDPLGSKDLDQALAIARAGAGFVVHYAIADLPRVVRPGGAVDAEARRRGQTMYAPDQSAPLHPRVISEDGASLLPGVERSAYVWRFELDESGNVTTTELTRARVRSREQLTYDEAQRRVDAGDELIGLLRIVGELRIALEAERGGAALDLPDEEIVREGGVWAVERRQMLPVEQWNAQISLMTGIEAARMQLQAGHGILRTMPKPSPEAMQTFRDEVKLLGVEFGADEQYGAFLRRLDRAQPTTVAVLIAARALFRGATYQVLTGDESPDEVIQSAIGTPYAHATAPLRRLVDRYVLEHCHAIATGREVEQWAIDGLEGLAEIMATSSRTAGTLERECIAAVTAVVLEPLIGHEFDALIVDRRDERAELQLIDPPVSAFAVIAGEPGTKTRVRLEGISDDKPVFVA